MVVRDVLGSPGTHRKYGRFPRLDIVAFVSVARLAAEKKKISTFAVVKGLLTSSGCCLLQNRSRVKRHGGRQFGDRRDLQ